MKYYRRSYSGSTKVKKIMFRILFVIIAAAVITFGSIILGNYLQKKVAAAEALLNVAEPADSQITGRSSIPDSSAATRVVFGAGLEVSSYTGEDEIVAAVNELSGQYNTLVAIVDSGDASLVYTSPALCGLMKISTPSADDRLTLVKSAFTAAKSQSMFVCVVLNTSLGRLPDDTAALIDGTIAGELSSFGADEILFDDLVTVTEDIPANSIARYVNSCRDYASQTSANCEFGVIIPDEAYLNFKNAKSIQTIAQAADFTAIDMTADVALSDPDAVYAKTAENITSLFGSFSVYNMRVILSTLDQNILAAQYHSLIDNNIMNICFTDKVNEAELTYNSSDSITDNSADDSAPVENTVESDSKSSIPEQRTNPYAVVAPVDDNTDEGGN